MTRPAYVESVHCFVYYLVGHDEEAVLELVMARLWGCIGSVVLVVRGLWLRYSRSVWVALSVLVEGKDWTSDGFETFSYVNNVLI